MISKKNARLGALAAVIVFASTTAVLLARQLNLGPVRPAPAFRAFGPAAAPIQIYEYTDLACPACRYAAGALEEMLKIYGAGIRLDFKHYPLKNIHPWSMDAAAYADCAGEQGKFKDYAALLFESQEKWAQAKDKPAEFEAFARQLNLDWGKMQACSVAVETLKRVKLDMAEGDVKGVSATPTFFVNGKRAVGGGQLLEQAKKFDILLKGSR
ncbi:MAG TPA: thioredoxin domain-containing protein [Elusimicrobiales bacterium]|nr:thioredoxin domain-containing protein [Elusimicrobiales bacterium]